MGIIGLLLLLVVLVVALMNHHLIKTKCPGSGLLGKNHWMAGAPAGNLVTGGNNPYPFLQMGNAGWGGSLQSTYQAGDSRVFGGSNANYPGDDITTVPTGYVNCKQKYDPTALGEARVLYEAQALDEAMPLRKLDRGGSPSNLGYGARGLDDSSLMDIMGGGS